MIKLNIRRLLAAVFALLFLLPLVGGFMIGLRWEHFTQLFQLLPVGRYLGNSLLVVILAIPLTVLFSSLAGYYLIRLHQPWRKRLVAFAIVTMLVPPSAVWLFRYQMLSQVGLIDTRIALMLPALAGGSSLFVLIYFWAWRQASTDLFDAADIDGASFLQTWWQVALPLVRPATAAVGLLAFMLFWGNLIEPVLFIYDPQKYTLPLGLQLLNQFDASNRPLLLAGAIIASGPPLLLFLFTQRQFLQGEWVDE